MDPGETIAFSIVSCLVQGFLVELSFFYSLWLCGQILGEKAKHLLAEHAAVE
jgi:hypothetical protein